MPFDRFGLPFLYPSKTTAGKTNSGSGFFYEQSNDIRRDDEVKGMVERSGGGGISDVNTSTGEFTCNHESSDSFTINKDPSFSSSIGGCDMNFEDTEARGYGYKADQPRDIELKLLAKFIDARDDTGLSLSGPTGRHTDNNCCQGFAYMFAVENLGANPCSYRFRKEMWHVNYDTDPKTGNFTHPLASLNLTAINRYIGLCYVRYNKKDGRGPGKDSVIIEGWFNPDPAANKGNWIMMKRTEDKGGWGDGGDDCGGEPSQVGTWSNAVFRIKASDATIRYKNVSLREIDPTKTFDDEQNNPPPGEQPGELEEVQGFFKLLSDVNTIEQSTCAPGGSAIFATILPDSYEHFTNLSDQPGDQNRTAVSNRIETSASPWAGKKVQLAKFPVQKLGSPGSTPVVSAKIWDFFGNVLYTSPTTYDPSTLSTVSLTDPATWPSFDFSTNILALAAGHRIGVEYLGTSSSNKVEVGYTTILTVPNTVFNTWDTDGNPWQTIDSRELGCQLST